MGDHGAALGDAQEILQILQRVAQEAIPVTLHHASQEVRVQLRAVHGDHVVAQAQEPGLESLGLRPEGPVGLTFQERGRAYQAVAQVQRVELHRHPAQCVFAPPRVLACPNPDLFRDHVPKPPPRVTVATLAHALREGHAVGLSEGGLEVDWEHGHRSDFRLGEPLQISLVLGPDLAPCLDTRPVYFQDHAVGLEIVGAPDAQSLLRYRQWVRDRLHALQGHAGLSEDLLADRDTLRAHPRQPHQLHLLSDHPPHLLVVSEDAVLPEHLAQVLGRKFGVGHLDWLTGLLQPQLARPGVKTGWGGFRILLIHQRLHLTSGYELIRQVLQQEHCPLPVLMVGSEEELALKRNRAIAAGAVDFLPVEPFHVLTVMRMLEETLRSFG